MCDPVSLAIGTAVIGAGASIQAGNAQAASARYTASVQRNNATFLERQADDAVSRGRLKEKQQRLKNTRLIGSKTAALAAGNVSLAEGSPLDVLEFAAGQGEMDALIIREDAKREAINLRFKAGNERAGANLSELTAKSAKTGALFGAAKSLIGGASKVSDIQFKKKLAAGI